MSELILRVEYLTGRVVATAYHDREWAEWPPHPSRVYSAFVAHWAESEEKSDEERVALEWLASLGAPRIYASAASRRFVVPHFVPVNDIGVLSKTSSDEARLEELRKKRDELAEELEEAKKTGDSKISAKLEKSLAKAEKKLANEEDKFEAKKLKEQSSIAGSKVTTDGLKAAAELLPEGRGKQPRTFPSASPHEPRVFFYWDAEEAGLKKHRTALDMLAARIARIGHSSSFVACAFVSEGPTFNWEPDEQGSEIFRIPEEEQLTLLEEAFSLHREIEQRVLPCRFQGYRSVCQEPSAHEATLGVFSEDWLVFRRIGGERFPATAGIRIARAMRGALMNYADEPLPELLSGHLPDGSVSSKTHLAIVPLPFVGHQHASGELLGLALIPPKDTDESALASVYEAVSVWEDSVRIKLDDEFIDCPPLRLTLGRAGSFEIERIAWGNAPTKTLRPATWCAPSHQWVTVTPIALDRVPGDLFSRDRSKSEEAHRNAEEIVARACEHIGLPRPSRVQIHPSVPVIGALKARDYPPYPEEDKKPRRVKVHARLEFSVPIRGPLLLGAGRYLGLGLCMPLHDRRGD